MLAERQPLVVRQQPVEVAAVRGEAVVEAEDALERPLHVEHAAADGDAATQCRAQVLRGGKVIRVGVRLENPEHVGTGGAAVRDDLVGTRGARAPRTPVVVEHRVDHGGSARAGVHHDVGPGPRGLVVERVDCGLHGVTVLGWPAQY